MSVGALAGLDRLIVIKGRHLMYEVRSVKRRTARTPIRKNKTKWRADPPAPAKQQKAEVGITVKYDLGLEPTNVVYNEWKARQLFYYVCIPANNAPQNPIQVHKGQICKTKENKKYYT